MLFQSQALPPNRTTHSSSHHNLAPHAVSHLTWPFIFFSNSLIRSPLKTFKVQRSSPPRGVSDLYRFVLYPLNYVAWTNSISFFHTEHCLLSHFSMAILSSAWHKSFEPSVNFPWRHECQALFFAQLCLLWHVLLTPTIAMCRHVSYDSLFHIISVG